MQVQEILKNTVTVKTVKQLNKINNLTVKQLNSLEDYNLAINDLPVDISKDWYGAVAKHIKRFGYTQVYNWAKGSANKRNPERYFMTILRRQAETR